MYFLKENLIKNEKSRLILIEDSVAYPGRMILKTFLKLFTKESANILILCYDGLYDELYKDLDVINVCTCFDAFSDPFHWNKSNKEIDVMCINKLQERFSDFKGILCIDSLSPLMIHNGVNKIFRSLHYLLNHNPELQIVMLFHSDVHDEKELHILQMLITTHIVIFDNEKLTITVRYSSTKVAKHLLEYKISENYEFNKLSIVNLENKAPQMKQPDPTANLTFNLRLNESEKEVRSQVQLPFMKMQTEDEKVIQSLLEDEFYDEEDPDDDLDF